MEASIEPGNAGAGDSLHTPGFQDNQQRDIKKKPATGGAVAGSEFCEVNRGHSMLKHSTVAIDRQDETVEKKPFAKIPISNDIHKLKCGLLKVYASLIGHSFEVDGKRISFATNSDLADHTGANARTITRAITLLGNAGLLKAEKTGRIRMIELRADFGAVTWVKIYLDDPGWKLSDLAFKVWFGLLRFKGRNHSAFMTDQTLGQFCGLEVKQVKKGLRVLRESGLIDCQSRWVGSGWSRRVYFPMPKNDPRQKGALEKSFEEEDLKEPEPHTHVSTLALGSTRTRTRTHEGGVVVVVGDKSPRTQEHEPESLLVRLEPYLKNHVKNGIHRIEIEKEIKQACQEFGPIPAGFIIDCLKTLNGETNHPVKVVAKEISKWKNYDHELRSRFSDVTPQERFENLDKPPKVVSRFNGAERVKCADGVWRDKASQIPNGAHRPVEEVLHEMGIRRRPQESKQPAICPIEESAPVTNQDQEGMEFDQKERELYELEAEIKRAADKRASEHRKKILDAARSVHEKTCKIKELRESNPKIEENALAEVKKEFEPKRQEILRRYANTKHVPNSQSHPEISEDLKRMASQLQLESWIGELQFQGESLEDWRVKETLGVIFAQGGKKGSRYAWGIYRNLPKDRPAVTKAAGVRSPKTYDEMQAQIEADREFVRSLR